MHSQTLSSQYKTITHTHACTYMHIHIHTHTHIHTHSHTRMHTHTHAHTHMHIHAHTHTHSLAKQDTYLTFLYNDEVRVTGSGWLIWVKVASRELNSNHTIWSAWHELLSTIMLKNVISVPIKYSGMISSCIELANAHAKASCICICYDCRQTLGRTCEWFALAVPGKKIVWVNELEAYSFLFQLFLLKKTKAITKSSCEMYNNQQCCFCCYMHVYSCKITYNFYMQFLAGPQVSLWSQRIPLSLRLMLVVNLLHWPLTVALMESLPPLWPGSAVG